MAISGHKTRAIFDRYNSTSESDLKDAARKLGEYMEQKTKQAPNPQTSDARHQQEFDSVKPPN